MNDIETLLQRVHAEIEAAASEEALREAEVRYLGKKGEVTALLKNLGHLPPEERREAGRAVNEARARIEKLLADRREKLEAERLRKELFDDGFDFNLPRFRCPRGRPWHPVSIVSSRVSALRAVGHHGARYPRWKPNITISTAQHSGGHPLGMPGHVWLKNGCLLRHTHLPAGAGHARACAAASRHFPGPRFRYERTDASHEQRSTRSKA
jgi:hypothetical protein